MHIIYACGYCNKQFKGGKKGKTAQELCSECERDHRDKPSDIKIEYRYDERKEEYTADGAFIHTPIPADRFYCPLSESQIAHSSSNSC